MKYGMPTLLEFSSIEENINFAKNNKFNFIELNMNVPYCFNLKKGQLIKYNFLFTMHISEELNISELNEDLRKKYLSVISKQINTGINNNIKKYTIHLNDGIYFTLNDGKKYLNEIYLDLYIKQTKKSLIFLNKLAKDNNIFINFENIKINNFTKKAIELISSFDSLGFTLDIGHNEKNDNKAWNILKNTNKIRHIHLHDFNGLSDHLAIGDGKIDFNKYKDIYANCYIVIEVKTSFDLIKSINAL